MNKINFLCLFFLLLFFAFGTATAQVSNTQADFSCPGQVTVTYDLISAQPVNATLYYSPNKCDWVIAATVTGDLFAQTTGTNKTIIWNNYADNVRFGKFYFKVEISLPSLECSQECIMINGVCWATCNVDMPGTFVSQPSDAGMFYQWGSNVGWSSTDPLIASDGINTWRSLCESGSVWLPQKDPCPAGWRVPTYQELYSLSGSNGYWGILNGINGRFFGEGQLFLPIVGTRGRLDGELSYDASTRGFYWSSTYSSGTHAYDLYLLLITNSIGISTNYRDFGMSIRCVSE